MPLVVAVALVLVGLVASNLLLGLATLLLLSVLLLWLVRRGLPWVLWFLARPHRTEGDCRRYWLLVVLSVFLLLPWLLVLVGS